MKMFLVTAALQVCALPESANAQTSISNTYHVEVRMHYIGYVAPGIAADYEGSSYWHTQFTTSHRAEAEFVRELFATALQTGGLEILLGLDPLDWLATDVRLRTEYAMASRQIAADDPLTFSKLYLRRLGYWHSSYSCQ